MLVALIALQSVVAIADAHQPHQAGVEHLEFNHDDDKNTVDNSQHLKKVASSPSIDQYDCHHCCHCHGVVHFFLATPSLGFDASLLVQELTGYWAQYPSILISPDLRPPIA